jgi:hypothetical protein
VIPGRQTTIPPDAESWPTPRSGEAGLSRRSAAEAEAALADLMSLTDLECLGGVLSCLGPIYGR